jgi:hypothetical protein
LPLINSGRVELLDHPRLVNQLCSLERRTARSGRDSIDHAPGADDDIVNAAAGAVSLASAQRGSWASVAHSEGWARVQHWASQPQLANRLDGGPRYAPMAFPRMSTTPPAAPPFPPAPPPAPEPEPAIALDQTLHTPDRPHHFVDVDLCALALERDLASREEEAEQ